MAALTRLIPGRSAVLLLVLLIAAPGLARASMPLGHLYAAIQVHRRLPPRLHEIVKNNRNAYLLGCQGHDLAYWAPKAELLRWFGDFSAALRGAYSHPDQPGMYLHEDGRTGQLIRAMFKLIVEANQGGYPSKYDYRVAFALGWLSHYVTDTFIHTLVERYGGVYDTPAGQSRHVQLELVESKHVAAKYRLPNLTFQQEKRVFTFLTESLARVYPDTDAFKGYRRPRVIHSGRHLDVEVRIEWDYYPPDFIRMLDYGTAIMADAFECIRESNASGKTTCSQWARLGWEYMMGTRLVSQRSYEYIMTPLELELVTEPDQVIARVLVNDHGLYGKFCRDWDQVIAMAVGHNVKLANRIDELLTRIDGQRKAGRPIMDIDVQLLGPVPDINILSPEKTAHLLPAELLTYFREDPTVKGDPYPAKEVYFEAKLGQRKVKERIKLRPPVKGEARKLDYLFHSMSGMTTPKDESPIAGDTVRLPGFEGPDGTPLASTVLERAELEIPLEPDDPPVDELVVKASLTDDKPFGFVRSGAGKEPFFQGVEFVVQKGVSEFAVRLPGTILNAYAGEAYTFTARLPMKNRPRRAVFLWRFSDGGPEVKTESNRVSRTFAGPGQYYIAVTVYDKKSGARVGRGGTMAVVNASGLSEGQRAVIQKHHNTQESAYIQLIGQYPGADLEEKFQAYARANRKKLLEMTQPGKPIDYEPMIRQTLDKMRRQYSEENQGAEMPAAQIKMIEKTIRAQVGALKKTYAPPPANLYKPDKPKQ